MSANSENPACPILPSIDRALAAADSRALGKVRGAVFYEFCHRYAQSKWMAGLPAQALLQLNKAMSADLDGSDPILLEHPIPNAAMAWLLEQRPDRRGQFFGNPRRHWQHYATRMSGPRSELRTWRAWACHAIATRILPAEDFPNDEDQIATEGVVIPQSDDIFGMLGSLGLPGEAELWAGVLQSATSSRTRVI